VKKNLFIFIFIIIGILFIFPAKKNFNTSTILVVIDESENGEIVINEAPISDGIFDALWEDDQIIFFDMKIQNSLNFDKKDLDINPFINDAKGAGADSILLIKVDYSFKEIKNYYLLNVKEYYYNFYSITAQKSLSAGKRKLIFNKRINKNEKKVLLNKFGTRIIHEIYN
jgi:hypothetical protein